MNGRLIGRSCDRSHRWRGYRRIPQKRYAVPSNLADTPPHGLIATLATRLDAAARTAFPPTALQALRTPGDEMRQRIHAGVIGPKSGDIGKTRAVKTCSACGGIIRIGRLFAHFE